METGEERTGTNCDSRRGRGARAAVTEMRTSEEFGRDLFVYFYPRKARVKCHKFPKRKQIKQLPQIVDFCRREEKHEQDAA